MRFSRMVNVVKCHVGGEVSNVVTGGIGDVAGATVFEKMKYFRDHDDDLRKLLLNEPRGAVTHCVNYIVPATDPQARLGYVIAESHRVSRDVRVEHHVCSDGVAGGPA